MAPERKVVVDIVGDAKGYSKATADAIKGSKGLTGELDKLDKRMRGFAKGGIGGALLGGAGIGVGLGVFGLVEKGVGAVVDVVGDAINAASDMNEAQSKVNVVFGKQADIIRAWARTSAMSMGLSERAALKAVGTFGNLFDGLGLTEQATTDLSRKVVQLAADLGSFNNVGTDEALQALQSGLLGEAEPMRRFGVALSEAKVQAYGMQNGLGELIKTGKTFKFVMSDAEKVQARFGLILEGTKNAQGDFARTADGLANSQKSLAANIDNLTTSLGQMLTGPAADFTGFLNTLVTSLMPDHDTAMQAATDYVNRYGKAVAEVVVQGKQLDDQLKAQQIAAYAAEWQKWLDTNSDFGSIVGDNGRALEWLRGVNVEYARTTGWTVEALATLAAKMSTAGKTATDFMLAMTGLQAQGIDLAAMAKRYVSGFTLMDQTTEGFTRSWVQMTGRLQSGAVGFKEWGDYLIANLPWIRKHFGELAPVIQKTLSTSYLGLDDWPRAFQAVTDAGAILRGVIPDFSAVGQAAVKAGRQIDFPARQTARTVALMQGTLTEALDPYKRAWAELAEWAKDPFRPKAFAERIKEYHDEAIRRARRAAEDGRPKVAERWRAVARAMKNPIAIAAIEIGLSAQQALTAIQTVTDTKAALQRVKDILTGIGNNKPGRAPKGTGGAVDRSGPRASGGAVAAGGAYVVGELGRELFVPEQDGAIIPNGQLERMGRGGRGGDVHINVTVHAAPGANGFRIGQELAGFLEQYARGGGQAHLKRLVTSGSR